MLLLVIAFLLALASPSHQKRRVRAMIENAHIHGALHCPSFEVHTTLLRTSPRQRQFHRTRMYFSFFLKWAGIDFRMASRSLESSISLTKPWCTARLTSRTGSGDVKCLTCLLFTFTESSGMSV